MAELFTPDEIRKRFGDLPYVTPYQRIVALVDEDAGLVELHEYHARGRCTGGAAWETCHYARTSPLVVSARREGARNIFVCREGLSDVSLEPGIAGAGLEEVKVSGGEVALTYAGLAGGGVAATLCRGMASNVLSAEIHERGGGAALGRATLRLPAWRKLTVGVDDTDDAERGATWSTVNEIAFEIEQDGMADYLLHTIAQLFPDNPFKTTNCCATAAVFGVPPAAVEEVVALAREMLGTRTFSGECGMAWSTRVPVPGVLADYARNARQGMVTIEDARSAASAAEVTLVPVTGERGCIGAIAAVGMHSDPDAAVVLPGAGA